jgi:hypothetical protein
MSKKLKVAPLIALLWAVVIASACDVITNPDPPVQDPVPPPPAPGARATATRSTLAFEGTSRFRASGGSVNVEIQKIVNSSTTRTSGSLRIDLWATASAYGGGDIQGYRTASVRTRDVSGLSDQLRPNSSFSNLSLNLAFSPPPLGYTHFTLVLAEFDSSCDSTDRYCISAALPMR